MIFILEKILAKREIILIFALRKTKTVPWPSG